MGITLTSNFDVNAALPLDSRMVVADLTARDAIAAGRRFQGMCVYVVSDTLTYQLKAGILNADWVEYGGGAVNLIENGDADGTSTSIFTPYLDSGSRPVDGVGAGSLVTTSVTSTNPLTGTKSYLLTKPAFDVQGSGWSLPATALDLSYRAKALKISVDYVVNSGTFVAGSRTTDSDIIWSCYDITNSKIVEPSNIKMFASSTTISDKYEATVQFDYNCTSFRLIAHCATTSTAAYEIKVDNVTVSPSVYVFGTPITDWQSFPMVITALTTNPTKNGSPAIDKARWRRVGDSMEITYAYYQTAAGTAGSGNYFFSIPSGFSIDTTKINVIGDTNQSNVGSANGYSNASGGPLIGTMAAASATTLMMQLSSEVAALNPVSSSYAALSATGLTYNFSARVPILGWSSSVQMSDSFDGRNITAEVYRSSAQGSQAITATTQKIIFGEKTKDSVNSFDTTLSRYTILSAGDYKFTPRLSFSILGANGQADLLLYKNGSGYKTITSGFTTAGASHNLTTTFLAENCVAGDYFEIFVSSSTTMQMLSAATILGGSQLSIEKIQGPSAIAANETINAVYTTAAGQSIPNATDTIIDFGTAEINSHGNVVTGAAWKFTASISGVYEVSAFVQLNSGGGWAVSEEAVVAIFKGGTGLATIGLYAATTVNSVAVAIPCTPKQIRLLAGEYIDVRINQNSGAAVTLVSSGLRNWVSIKRVGN